VQRQHPLRHTPRCPPAPAAPQHGSDARQQLAWIARLGQIVIRPHLKADDSVDRIAPTGEHDHRQLVTGAQLLQQLQPALARHHDVEHQQIGLSLRQPGQRRFGIMRRFQRKTFVAQVLRQQLSPADIILSPPARLKRLYPTLPFRHTTLHGSAPY
jgi:hypothetical protein